MANIADGFLTISLNKASKLNKGVFEEVINNLKNNGLFTYGGDCDITFNEERKEIQVGFSGRWSCDSCWEWINNELSDGKNNKELSSEARTLLINSEIDGYSYEWGTQYRDRVEKKSGAKKLNQYYHTKLDSEWPEVLEIINAYNLNQGDSKSFNGTVKITLREKSEEGKYLFEINGVEDYIILIDKASGQVEFSYDDALFINKKFDSIKKILDGIKNSDLEQDRGVDTWDGNGETIDDLIGDIDEFYELIEDYTVEKDDEEAEKEDEIEYLVENFHFNLNEDQKKCNEILKILEKINAFDLKKGDALDYGSNLLITLCEKSKEEHLFKIKKKLGKIVQDIPHNTPAECVLYILVHKTFLQFNGSKLEYNFYPEDDINYANLVDFWFRRKKLSNDFLAFLIKEKKDFTYKELSEEFKCDPGEAGGICRDLINEGQIERTKFIDKESGKIYWKYWKK